VAATVLKEADMSQKRQVRARFWGTGMVASEHISVRGAAASVTESFMVERKAPDVVAMWLDGTRHPKVGILGLPPVDTAAVPYTGKRLRNWQQLEPWNREKVHSSSGTRSLDHVRDRDFWEWFESSICNSHPGPHLHELVLQGSDHATLENAEGEATHPWQQEENQDVVIVPPSAKVSRRNDDGQAGSRRWIEEKTRDRQSGGEFFYDRILSSIILPEPMGSQPHPLLTDAQLAVDPSTIVPIPNLGIRKRTLLELGTLGLLRELDGDWLALEEEASTTDLDSEISREIRALIQVLKNEERIINAHISCLKGRVENDDSVFGKKEDTARPLKTVDKWEKLQRKKFQILEQKFLERLGIE
jgi:hypothetical protein